MEKLGINPLQLVAQIVNFLIVFFVLSKLLYKTILKVLGDREKKIRESFEYSEKIKKEWEQLGELKEAEMVKARTEAEKIVKQAENMGQEERQNIVAEAKTEAENLVKKELKNYEEKRKQEENEMREKTVEMSALITQQLIKDYLDPKAQQNLINEAVERLKEIEVKE